MAVQAYFNYAEIDPETNMCMSVVSSTVEYPAEDLERYNYVEIPVYDEDYTLKYYINGNWYEDAEGTIPWSSSLL